MRNISYLVGGIAIGAAIMFGALELLREDDPAGSPGPVAQTPPPPATTAAPTRKGPDNKPSEAPLAGAAFVGMQVQGITPVVAAALGLEKASGVLVRDVALGGPSAEAGFRRGDLIVRFAGRDVDTFETLVTVVKGLKADQDIKAKVVRRGAEVELTMKTGAWAPSWRITNGAFANIPAVGLTLASLTGKIRDVFSLRWGSTGVVITLVDLEKSVDMDLQRGDLILQVNQEAVWSPDQVVAKYREAKEKKLQKILLLVEGPGGFRFSLLPVR